jgi:hypothetical protein
MIYVGLETCAIRNLYERTFFYGNVAGGDAGVTGCELALDTDRNEQAGLEDLCSGEAILTEVPRTSPQTLVANSEMVPQLGHVLFVLSPLQTYHPTL